jgi:hypothetical protein
MHHNIKVHLLIVDIFYIRNCVAALYSSICYFGPPYLQRIMLQFEITVVISFDSVLCSGDTMRTYNLFPKACFISIFLGPTARDTLQSSHVLHMTLSCMVSWPSWFLCVWWIKTYEQYQNYYVLSGCVMKCQLVLNWWKWVKVMQLHMCCWKQL